MNPELYMVFLPGVSLVLFSLGGTKISETIGGQKWVRRFLLTFIYGLCVFLAGMQWWQGLAVFALSCLMFHLGYGDRSSWPLRALIFLGYGAISLPFGVSYWNAITAVVCFLMMLFSNIHILRTTFVWKICEGMFGCLVGIQISFLLAGNGWIWKF